LRQAQDSGSTAAASVLSPRLQNRRAKTIAFQPTHTSPTFQLRSFHLTAMMRSRANRAPLHRRYSKTLAALDGLSGRGTPLSSSPTLHGIEHPNRLRIPIQNWLVRSFANAATRAQSGLLL